MHPALRRGGEEEKGSSYQVSAAEIEASAASTVLLARPSCGRGGRGVVLSSEKKPFSDFSQASSKGSKLIRLKPNAGPVAPIETYKGKQREGGAPGLPDLAQVMCSCRLRHGEGGEGLSESWLAVGCV